MRTGEKTTTEADLSDRSTPQFPTTPTRFLEPDVKHDTATVHIGLGEWAKTNHGTLPTIQCRNHRQLGIGLRGAVNEGMLKKRASNGKAFYLRGVLSTRLARG